MKEAKPPVIRPAPPQIVYVTPLPPRRRGPGFSLLQILGSCFVLFLIIPIIGIIIVLAVASSGGPTSPATASQPNREWISNFVAEIKDAQGTERESKLRKLIALDPNTKEFPEEIAQILEVQRKLKAEADRRISRAAFLGTGFSSWDGSHRGLTKVIKESMNDPKSYEHVETVYWDKGDRLIVQTTFRGKNGFGGVVKNRVKAETDLDGNVLKIIAQGP